jgi:hypothetical protein
MIPAGKKKQISPVPKWLSPATISTVSAALNISQLRFDTGQN